MEKQYETHISTARWMAYDIPGNVGWIAYLVCLWKLIGRGFDAFAAFSALAALLMLVGVVELVSERIAGLDRVLPRIRLLRGFGALTLGGVAGVIVSAVGWIAGAGGGLCPWMLGGSALCAVFAGLCYKGYRAV